MLNIKDIENKDSNGKLNDYSFNISDEQILNNELFKKVIKEFIHNLGKEKDEEMEDISINIKLYYKIPSFFNIYREIKKYLQDEKISFYYKQDEGELRKYEYEQSSLAIEKLKNDMKEFIEKIYDEFSQRQLINKVFEAKIDNKNYLEFTEVFLNDYITFYLVNLYKNNINDFAVNDTPHKIILLLLDLKFKGLKEEEKYTIPLENAVSQILWLEGNANYIKDILNLYKIISGNIFFDEKGDILFKKILNYISKYKIKYEPKEKQLIKVNEPYYILIKILIKYMIDKESIDKSNFKNDNYYSYFKVLEKCLKEIQKLDKVLKLDINELSLLNEFITIYNACDHAGKIKNLDANRFINSLIKSFEIVEKNEDNKISLLCENLIAFIENIEQTLYFYTKITKKNKKKNFKAVNKIYYELISNLLYNEAKRENNLKYKIFILEEFLLKDKKLFIRSTQLLKLILNDFVTSNVDLFQGSLNKLSDPKLKVLEDNINDELIKDTLLYTFEQISIIYIQNLRAQNGKRKKENQMNILINIKTFFENCIKLLENSYKDPELKLEEERNNLNINLRKIFAISFIRVYLKVFIDWISRDEMTKNSDIEEIISIVNGEENSKFRDILIYFIYKIIYNMNKLDINELFEEKIVIKYHLESYKNFDLFKFQKNEDNLEEKDPKNIISIIKEINSPEIYIEEDYPYYKSFLYSDFPDEVFLKKNLKENEENYPTIDLYLNREKRKRLNSDFIYFNFVIKSLTDNYSNKISKNVARKLPLENTLLYTGHTNICNKFIEIVNSRFKDKKDKLTKESSLENFFIDNTTEKGKLYKEIYTEYSKIQNDMLNEISEKLKEANYEPLECLEINIQEAQRENLLFLEFENESDFIEILLENTFRKINNSNSKNKIHNYNLFLKDLNKIEKLFQDSLIRNACFLKTDEIVEMKYIGEEFLNDGIFTFNKNIATKNLEEKDKKALVIFYQKYLETNLESCLEVNIGLKNIIEYVNHNFQKINSSKSLWSIIKEEKFRYELNKDLKNFLNENINIIVSKLSNLMIYLERLYFKLAMKEREEYKEKLDNNTKNQIETYYKEKKDQLITKDKLSLAIIRFLLNDAMNQKEDKYRLFELNDNLFMHLNNHSLWDNNIINDGRFTNEIEEYTNLGIYIKNSYDFYMDIATDSINEFEKEIKNISEEINSNEKIKLEKEKQDKGEEFNKKIENQNNEKVIIQDLDDDLDMDNLDAY